MSIAMFRSSIHLVISTLELKRLKDRLGKCEPSDECILLWNVDGESPGSYHDGPLGWVDGETVRDRPLILTLLHLENKHSLKVTKYMYTYSQVGLKEHEGLNK